VTSIASLKAVRTLPCGCVIERTVSLGPPVPSDWIWQASRSLAMVMRLTALAHKCPKEST